MAQANGTMVQLSGNVSPALARASLVVHRDPSSVMNVIVALKLRNTGQLHEFLQAVQDPTSSIYHQFLTPQEFNAMYGPTAAQAAAVAAYLKQQGLNVIGVTPDNRLIHVKSTSGALERAFGIRMNDYTYHGRAVFGTPDSPQFPSAIASSVQAVLGLSDIVRFHPDIVPPSGFTPATSGGPVGYSPQQIATAYNWPSITNTAFGAGVTIAILEFNADGFTSSDPAAFWSYYGLPSHTLTVTNMDTGTPGSVGLNNTEATVDVERAGAMAPGATIAVYDALVTSDPLGSTSFLGAMAEMLDKVMSASSAKVVSISYGSPESDLASGSVDTLGTWENMHSYFETAAAENISVFASAGDDGYSDGVSGDTDVAGYPSSDPYVVAAGGTSLTLTSSNTISSEVVCNDASGATGGAQSSIITPEPSWQVGNGVPQNGVRNTSDVSMDADPNTGYSVYEGGGWLAPPNAPGGGTSFVAPQLAALTADWISLAGGEDMGAADPDIYADANSSNYGTDFHDITSGSNGAFSAGPGWDHPTGWGSINADELLTHIAGGIALSPPQNISDEYLGCVGNADEYKVSWQAPAIGTPTGYNFQWDEP
ncbi:MAG: S53 family peptidase, partial [Gammaproteobacteria bacterium]